VEPRRGVVLLIHCVERVFPRVAEGGMAQVVSEGNRLGKIFVEAQGASNGARNLGDFEGMGQASAVVVGLRRDEDLRLVAQAPKCLRVDDAITVTLKGSANGAGRLWAFPASSPETPCRPS